MKLAYLIKEAQNHNNVIVFLLTIDVIIWFLIID